MRDYIANALDRLTAGRYSNVKLAASSLYKDAGKLLQSFNKGIDDALYNGRGLKGIYSDACKNIKRLYSY